MKKVLFIALAAILALSIGLVGCGEGEGEGEVPTAIKVGLVRDTDGVLAFYDQIAGGPVYRAFNKSVNLGGGVFMSAYNKSLPIELVIREYDPMSPGELTLQTTALITADKVHFIWGGPGTGTIYEQAPICDAYGVLLFTLEGGATDMMADPEKLASWSNTFINLSFSDWYQIPVLYKMLLGKGVSAPKAYVLYIDNEHGHEYLNVTRTVFGAGNVTSLGHDPFIATQDDINDIIVDAMGVLNTTGFDIFCAFSYMPYLGYVQNAFDSYDFDPPGIILGPGGQSGAWLLVYGNKTEGLLGFATGNNKTSVAPEAVTMSLAAMWNLVLPEAQAFPPPYAWDPWGHPTLWAGLEMWKEAVETVGHLDVGYTAQVRSVLVGFNETNPATTVMGNCWYKVLGGGLGGGVIDYKSQPAQICQWKDLYPEIVGYTGITGDIPKYDVTGNFTYPMTGLWNWLP